MPRFPTSTATSMAIGQDEARELRQFAVDCENEVLRHYEDFLYVHNERVHSKRWKLVKTREACAVYRARALPRANVSLDPPMEHWDSSQGSSQATSTSFKQGSSSSSLSENDLECDTGSSDDAFTMEIGPMAAISASSTQPVLLLVGSLNGTLDDCMYSMCIQDTASIRERNVYQANGILDTSMMATIEQASCEDPFQYLGVGWLKLPLPSIAGLVKPRDAVVLVSSHLTATTRGEPIGVWLTHSVESDAMPPRVDGSVIRAKMSVCIVFRQQSPSHVQVFQTNFFDLRGSLVAPLLKQRVAQLIATTAQTSETVLLRKLSFSVRHRARNRQLPRQVSDHRNERGDAICGACRRTLTVFSTTRYCELCQQGVCSKCCVEKMLVVNATGNVVVTQSFVFCLPCIVEVGGMNAFDMACREADEAGDLAPTRPAISSINSSTKSER